MDRILKKHLKVRCHECDHHLPARRTFSFYKKSVVMLRIEGAYKITGKKSCKNLLMEKYLNLMGS